MVVAGNFYWARDVAARMAAVPVSGTGSIGDGGLTGKARFQRARDVAAKMAAVPVSGAGSSGDGGLTGKARFQRARGVAAKMAAVPVSITTAKMAAILVNERIKR